MNPQLSSFGSELELNDVRETIQQLLRWGWKYNKNLEEQAAQLHMLIGWSQVVEVYTFFYLFHITPLQNFSYGLVSVFLDTYQLHVFSVLFPPLIASLGLCIEKTFSSWKSSWNFVPVSLPITIRASLPPYSGIFNCFVLFHWQIAWCLFDCISFSRLLIENDSDIVPGVVHSFTLVLFFNLAKDFSSFLHCGWFCCPINISQGCTYMHGQATWWKIFVPWWFKFW